MLLGNGPTTHRLRYGGARPDVSVFLVELVLKAKMPLDMKSRAAKKLALVCLAKVCHNDNGLECYPSRATLARAAERSERTIDAFLDDLRRSRVHLRDRQASAASTSDVVSERHRF